jgi:hypothetical protein
MKRVIGAAFAALLVMQMGCDSESTKTYGFKGEWLFADLPGVCSQTLPLNLGGQELPFETMRVTVYSSESDIKNGNAPVATDSFPCEDGSFEMADLKRGSYFVTVEAMVNEQDVEIEIDAGVSDTESSESEIRAYYIGSDTVVLPTATDETLEFDMGINRGSIEVTWDFEDGNCSSSWNDVKTVIVELTGNSSSNDEESDELACTLDGQKYLFDDLNWDIYTVTVTGFDPDGMETFAGSFDEPIEIRPGTDISGRDGIIKLLPIEKK